MVRSILQAGTVLASAAIAAFVSVAHAQEAPASFPSEPIKLVVPYPPGGTVDILARALADGLSPLLPQPVVVDNRPGAGGTIAAAHVASATPDGHTLFVSDLGPVTISRSIYSNLSYDSLTDLAPISIATIAALNLTVNPSVEAKTVAEFIAMAKADPGKVTYASSGVGTIMHMAGALFELSSGTELSHIPYKGGAAAVTAVLSGEVQAAFNQLSTTKQHIDSGAMRSLGVSSANPARLAPDIPTIASQGVDGYDVLVWQGVLAPAGTPEPVVNYLNAKIAEVLAKPEIKKGLEDKGFEVVTNSPKEFGELIARDAATWEKVAKARDIKAE